MADRRRGFRARIARRLRYAADRTDPAGAPRATSMHFTFEDYIGIVVRGDGRGCRLWYLGDDDYERAHDEAGPVTDPSAETWLPQRRRRDGPGASAEFRLLARTFMDQNDDLLRRPV